MPQRLYDAADRGDAAAVAEFLREGDDANEAANDWAPLHAACFKGHFDAVKALLDGGADVRATIRDEHEEARHRGATPLHMAARHGHANVVRLLLDAGADPLCVDGELRTPLHAVAAGGHGLCVKALLDAGAEVEGRDSKDCTPLELAERGRHMGTARMMRLHVLGRASAGGGGGAAPTRRGARGAEE